MGVWGGVLDFPHTICISLVHCNFNENLLCTQLRKFYIRKWGNVHSQYCFTFRLRNDIRKQELHNFESWKWQIIFGWEKRRTFSMEKNEKSCPNVLLYVMTYNFTQFTILWSDSGNLSFVFRISKMRNILQTSAVLDDLNFSQGSRVWYSVRNHTKLAKCMTLRL